MSETGIDGIDTLDPPPLGTVELAEAKSRFGDRFFLKGNLDAVNEMLHAAGDELARADRGMDYVFVLDISGSMSRDNRLMKNADDGSSADQLAANRDPGAWSPGTGDSPAVT